MHRILQKTLQYRGTFEPGRGADVEPTDSIFMEGEIMKHTFREENGIGILELHGKLMGESEDLKLINMIDKFAEDNIVNVVMDFSRVEWTNSRGVGICMTGKETLEKHGGKLKMAGMCDKVTDIFKVTHVCDLFEVFDTVEEALASFTPG
ncbi:MAG: STAS domain-containing protein [Candidatus Zixiibacteriota bacterium]|nr:MAG: STAS domain-containing protein [candidate division Zixibacteria bacterium]